MESVSKLEREKENSYLGFMMIKGDLGKEIIADNPANTNNPKVEDKINSWLASLKEYAFRTCGVEFEITQTKMINGLNKEQLIKLYGEEHGEWMNGLSEEDFKKQMEVFDGTMSPIVLATVRVKDAANAEQTEKMLIRVRNSLRKDWHGYLGKKEIVLPGGSRLMFSAMHVGNYDNDKPFLQNFGLA